MIAAGAQCEEEDLRRQKQQIQQWSADEPGKENRLHGIDDAEAKLRNIESQHGGQPGDRLLISQPEAACGAERKYARTDREYPINIEPDRDEMNGAEEKEVGSKVPYPLPFSGKAADKKDVHHRLTRQAEPIQAYAEILHVRRRPPSYGAEGPVSAPVPAAGRRGWPLPGAA